MQQLVVKTVTARVIRGLKLPGDIIELIFEFAFPTRRDARMAVIAKLGAERVAVLRGIPPKYLRKS